MADTQNTVNKQVYVSKENLQYVLGLLRAKNETLYLRKGAEAASAAKVKSALTLTVGDTDVVFDGSEVKSAAVAAASHKHTVTDINDFSKEVKKVVFGDENSGTVAAHSHSNLPVLEKISDDHIVKWNAKIGVDDIEKLKYTNATAMPGVDNVKTAIDILVKNIQINSAVLSDATANVNGLATKLTAAEGKITALENANKEGGAVANAIADAKAAANEAKAAVTTEQARAEAAEKGLADRLDAVEGEGEGSIKKALADAKTYADGKDTAIAAAKKAGDDAQKDVDALAGKVGTVAEGKTVVELIADAEKAGTDAAAAVVTERQRAQQAEQANAAAAKAAQDDVDALEIKVGEVPADKTVVQMIAEAKTAATYDDTALKNRVATIEGDYLKAADKTALQGNIDTVSGVANAAKTKIDTFMAAADVSDKAVDTLKEIQDYITSDGTAAQKMTQDIAANAKAIKDEADRAKAAEKVNADDIAILKGADTVEGSVAKAVKEAKEALQANIDKKVDKSAYDTKIAELVKADTDNLATAKKYADDEDAKIEAILGHKAIEGGEGATGLCADVAANAAAIAAETTARQNADKLLSDRIAKFEGEGDGSVTAQVKAVADDLKAHKEAQVTKEAEVDGKLAVIQCADNVDGSIAKALKDAKAYADAEDAKIEALLGTKEDTSAKDTAFGKIVAEKERATAAEEALAGDITGINSDISTIQAQLANLIPLTNSELDAMLNEVYK